MHKNSVSPWLDSEFLFDENRRDELNSVGMAHLNFFREVIMIGFEDFAPRLLKSGFFSREFESFEAALAGANEWIDSSGADVVNIETVVLPQIWREDGTTDVDLRVGGETSCTWHQFIRVWFKS